MKQKGIASIICKRFKKLNRNFRKIIIRFEATDIHEFRTDVKKLRAFFRVLNVEIGEEKLKISKEMKTFYGYAGTIRNLQLQLKNMSAYRENPHYTVIEAYIDYLKKMIEKWKANINEFIEPGSDFSRDEKNILEHLAEKLSRSSAKRFLQNKINELTILFAESPTDEVLHEIRKILKDILYNWIFIKQYDKLLPAVFSDEDKIKSFTEMLGLFMDKSVAIILLETYCKDCEENGIFMEKGVGELQEIEDTWKREKEEVMKIIYLNPGVRELISFSRPVA